MSEKAKGQQSAKVIGGTAVVGAIIGAIAGGGKGAAIGAAAGAGTGAAIQVIHNEYRFLPRASWISLSTNHCTSNKVNRELLHQYRQAAFMRLPVFLLRWRCKFCTS